MKTLFDQDITLDEAEKLIKNGADIHERAEDGATPLFYIKNIEVAKLLIENGADVNEKDDNFDTPLHFARNVHIARLLIDHGANVNASDRNGYTPLFFTGNIDIIILLVNNGANINHRNAFHVTTFNVNSNNQKKDFLIANGAVPSMVDIYDEHRHHFSTQQQEAFDLYKNITNNDEDFFKMCLAYQEGMKNPDTLDIKGIELNI